MVDLPRQGLRNDQPTWYRIRIQGLLSDPWCDAVNGMELTYEAPGHNETVTVLSGLLPDQAALAGILQLVFMLRLPLLSVECHSGSLGATRRD